MFKKYLKYVLVGIIVLGLFFYFKISDQKKAEEEKKYETLDAFDEQISKKCEKGEWIDFPPQEELKEGDDFIENVKLKYINETEQFTNEDGSLFFLTNQDYLYSLAFFVGREARIEGKKTNDNKVFIKKIKCVGPESNTNIAAERQKLMQYIAKNINSLALEKSPRNDWQVDVFYFTENGDVYIQYESLASWEEEAPFDGRLWLVRPSNLDRETPTIETLAYILENGEDPEKNTVKLGEDIHENENFFIIYELDETSNLWTLQ